LKEERINFMDSMFIDILKKLIDEQGKEALLSSAKCKSLLADYTHNEYKKESRLLLYALEAGVSNAINTAKELDICKKQQVRTLNEDYSIELDTAAEVVDMLALVLRGEESEPAQSVCSNCGKELQKEWKVCPYCSTPEKKTQHGSSPTNAEELIDKGIKYYFSFEHGIENANKQFDEAINILNKVIELNPNDASAYVLRGDAYRWKKQYDMTIKDLSEAIRLNPNDAKSYYIRGMAYHGRKEYKEAISDYTDVIRLEPKSAHAYINRGHIYRDREKYKEAIEDFTAAINLDPNRADYYVDRGRAHKRLKEDGPAYCDFRIALKIEPNYIWLKNEIRWE
jgi:tetratricopeptide (TPR) repeat protein